jgi:hypothetical protein
MPLPLLRQARNVTQQTIENLEKAAEALRRSVGARTARRCDNGTWTQSRLFSTLRAPRKPILSD